MHMLLHLYGPDTYRRNRYLRTHLLLPYQKKYADGQVGFFDIAEEGEIAKLKEFIGTPGLFAKVGLAVVYHPEEARSASSGRGEKEFIKFLKTLADDTASTVIVVADKKPTKDFAFLLNGKEKEFEPLTGLDFLKFLKADAADQGLVVNDAQLKEIGAVYDGDLWSAMTEIQRVAFGGAVTERARQFDFIGLIRTLTGVSRGEQKLKALALLLEYDDAAKVFNMAAAFAGGAGKVKMADYDIAIKSGKLGYEEALLEYALTG